ncbi:MAG: inositol monophosphatase family protein [archaeon]
MDQEFFINKVKEVFQELFSEIVQDGFDLDKTQALYADWDSFSHMELLSKLEKKFNISLEIEEVIGFDTARKFVNFLQNKIGKSEIQTPSSIFKNFSEVLNHWVKNIPDKEFIIDLTKEKTHTYSKFNKKVNQVASLLKEKGVSKGDIVALSIRNSAEFLIIYFATIRVGAIINPLPFSLSESELEKNLTFANPKIVFLEKINYTQSLKKYPVILVESSFLDEINALSEIEVNEPLDENSPACLYYSSGTTSDPKAVLYSHKNMISLIGSICRGFNHTQETVHFGFLPMGHTAITNYSFLPVAYAGGTLVLAENFIKIRTSFWDIISKYKATYVELVPTILFLILNTPYPNYSKENMSLKYVGCGSAPLPLDIQKRFQEKFNLPVANLYGLSETGPSHFDNPLEQGWIPGSIGLPLDINECKIVDDAFNELPINEIGEIALKGDNIFIGYYKNPEAYQKVIKNKYFLTGDLGYKDETGKFYYVDRKKDLIIKGGVNIFPGEVDEILFKHSSILEASTIGVPDVFFGEEVISFVTPKEKVSEQEILDHCSKHLQPFKCPKKIIFLDNLPKTVSGKLLRKELKKTYLSEQKPIEKNYEKELEVAINAAKEAGKKILKYFKSRQGIVRKSINELVGMADIESQSTIINILNKEFPSYEVFGEERTQTEISEKPTWVVDPVDGTHNFISGIPHFGISIGLIENFDFKLGVIYLPYEDKIFTAMKGKGAFCNNGPLKVSSNPSLANAVVCYDNQFYLDESVLKNYELLIKNTFTTRILGSAVRDFCFIAEGVTDARICNNTKLVDIAAGTVILTEAGGRVSDFNGNSITINSKQIIASNSHIHNSILELINQNKG